MSKRLIFFGNERIATGAATTVPVLETLVAAGYEVTAVVVAQNSSERSRQIRKLEVATVANRIGIPVLSPTKLSEVTNELASLKAKAGILVAYGKIVPQTVIDIFPRGIVNIHPSLLPKHRGPTPVESVILGGDKETGVSLMQLAAKMDAGPVYAQQVVPLRGNETKQILAGQLLELGKNMLLEHLPSILDGSLKPKAQDDLEATYDKLIYKADGKLDFTKPAEQLERQIRAYAGWPKSYAVLGATETIVTRSHVSNVTGNPGTLFLDDKQLGIHCSEGTLMIDNLVPLGKKEMSAAAFLAGYKL